MHCYSYNFIHIVTEQFICEKTKHSRILQPYPNRDSDKLLLRREGTSRSNETNNLEMYDKILMLGNIDSLKIRSTSKDEFAVQQKDLDVNMYAVDMLHARYSVISLNRPT